MSADRAGRREAVCQWHANERRSHLPIRSVLYVCHWQTAPEPAGEKRRAGGTRMSAGLISRFGRCFLFATGKPHPSRQARLRGRRPLLFCALRNAKQKKTVPAKNSEAIFWRPRFTRPLRAGKRANANFACSEGFLCPICCQHGAVGVLLRGIFLDMANTILRANWEFHCFSCVSAAFHKVLRSASFGGAQGGKMIPVWMISRFLG